MQYLMMTFTTGLESGKVTGLLTERNIKVLSSLKMENGQVMIAVTGTHALRGAVHGDMECFILTDSVINLL